MSSTLPLLPRVDLNLDWIHDSKRFTIQYSSSSNHPLLIELFRVAFRKSHSVQESRDRGLACSI